MDWRLMRNQLVGQLRSIRMIGVIGISCMLVAVQYLTTYRASYVIPPSESTLLRDVMLFSQYGTGGGMYLLLLPFLSALLGGSVVSSERYAGRLPMVVIREGRGRFLATAMSSGFVLGGVGGVMPMIANLSIATIRNPHLNFIDGVSADARGRVYSGKYILISSDSWIYPLYEFNQVLCILCVVLLIFVIAGLFSTVSVGVSFFVQRKYTEVLVPFVLSLVWWMLPSLTGGKIPDQWSHVIFLDFAPGADSSVRWQNYVGIMLSIALLLALSTVLACAERHRDAL
ncbi:MULTISPECIES: hypothetical protein [Bifidobacterium]|nr:hypothetical protein [Bifidobacterium ruminantium]